MKIKGVYQHNTKDCGVACLLTIIKYYKGNNTFENIRYLTKCDNNGVLAINIIEASKKLGFNARGLKCNIEDINNIVLPAIAHITINKGYYHYIVIEKIDNKNIYIFDPAYGYKTYKYEDFKKIWNNIIIELIPFRKLDKLENKNNLIKYILKINKYFYIIVLFISSLTILLAVINNYYFKMLLSNNSFNIFILFTIFILIKEILEYIRNIFIIKLESKIEKNINKNISNKLLSLPYYYFNSRSVGDITSRIQDLEYIKELLVKVPISLIINIMLIIFSFLFMININKKLFIIFLIPCVLYLIIILLFNKRNKILLRNNQENISINNQILIENIKTINTIKNLNIEDQRNQLYNTSINKYINNKIKYENILNIENILKNIVIFIGINIVLYYGIIYVNNNELTIGNLILFNSLMIYFIDPIRSIYELSSVFKNGINSLKRINEILIFKKNSVKYLSTNKYNIKVKNLSYSYNNYDYVLRNINLNIKEKDKVLVIGKSGSGKSTLFKIINKTYEIDNNKVFIGDIDVNNLNISNYVSYISQEESLFNDTIYNNIFINNKYNKEVINITNVDVLIKNKNINLNTIIEEDGINFSRGERQKIILARTLLKNNKILILDEALNAIDEYEEIEILKDIINKYNDKTIIYITHRNNCKKLFNKIIKIRREDD